MEGDSSYKKLIVWQKSLDLVIAVYKLTDNFPKSELYGLVSQMRRCSVSIPSNIAEGKKRMSNNEFYRFLHIAYASGAELETQVIIAKRLNFGIDKNYIEVDGLLDEVMRMLNTIIYNRGNKN